MLHNTHILVCMLAAYLAPIAFVYYKYASNTAAVRSISAIITSTEPFCLFTPDTHTLDNNAFSAPSTPVFQTRHFIAHHGGLHRAL